MNTLGMFFTKKISFLFLLILFTSSTASPLPETIIPLKSMKQILMRVIGHQPDRQEAYLKLVKRKWQVEEIEENILQPSLSTLSHALKKDFTSLLKNTLKDLLVLFLQVSFLPLILFYQLSNHKKSGS